MNWNKESILHLEKVIAERWVRFQKEHKTDRKNLSELWNRHIGVIGVIGLRPKSKAKKKIEDRIGRDDLIEAINFRNHEVADALCVRNPDRFDQYLFVPRETASKIIALGMP